MVVILLVDIIHPHLMNMLMLFPNEEKLEQYTYLMGILNTVYIQTHILSCKMLYV